MAKTAKTFNKTLSNTSNKEAASRARNLLRLADASWEVFDKRRTYEWKINFALWTALAALAGLVIRESVSLSKPEAVGLTVALCLIGLTYWLLWSPGLQRANKIDQDRAHLYWGAVHKQLLGDEPPTVEGKVDSNKITTRIGLGDRICAIWHWSHGSQIIITVVLILVALGIIWARVK